MPKAIQVCCVRRALLSDRWFDIPWPVTYFSSCRPTSISGIVLLLLETTCLPIARVHCWSCKSKVPDLLFQAAFVVWPPFCWNLYAQGGCATLATLLQTYCKQCHELPWSEKESVCSRWCCSIFWVELEFRIIHHSTSWEISLQFVKVLYWSDQWD